MARQRPVQPRKGAAKPLPEEELARDATPHEEEAPDGKVRMTFRVLLGRQDGEALAAHAICEEKSLETPITGILETVAQEGRS